MLRILMLAMLVALHVQARVVIVEVDSDQKAHICGLYNPLFKELPHGDDGSEGMDVRIADPEDSCSELVGQGWESVAVLAKRGSCSFFEKSLQVSAVGGRVLIIQNNEESMFSPAANASAGEYDRATIPVIMVLEKDGERLQKLENKKIKLYEPRESKGGRLSEGLASLFLLCISVFVVYTGAIMATSTTKRSDAQSGPDRGQGDTQDDGENVSVQVNQPFLMFLVMCVQVMLLYFLYPYLVHVVILCFCIGSAAAIVVVLGRFVKAGSGSPCIELHQINFSATAAEIGLIGLGMTMSMVWYLGRHTTWAWILQNVLGIFLMLLVLETLKLPSMKTSTTLLMCLFVYDVFFVFITPLFTSSGVSVMEAVAIGSGEKEHMPMMIVMPYLAGPLSVCLGGSRSSMIGYGDIILPGMFVAYLRSIDLRVQEKFKGKSPRAGSYFTVGIVSYIAAVRHEARALWNESVPPNAEDGNYHENEVATILHNGE